MWCAVIPTICLITFIESRSIDENNTAVLISKYAKVAHWGVRENGTTSDNSGRRSGQSLWTHRFDGNLISGQHVKSEKPRVAYHHAVYKNQQSKVGDDKVERLPAVGEVIQDRYNPRPYFGYTKIPPKSEESATYGPPRQAAPNNPEFDSNSFPAVFNVAPSTPSSVDLYTSPYSSYNPPPIMADNPTVTDNYPPTDEDSYAAPPASASVRGIYDYKPKKPQEPPTPSYASLGPPLASAYVPDTGDDSIIPDDHHNHGVDAPPSDHIPMDHMPIDHIPIDNESGPQHYPPELEQDIYYPPDVSNGAHDHSPKGFFAVQDTDMNHAPSDHGRFPQYLYDSHQFNHHIYEEVPHTTTEAVEDKRVSSVNYSYYYLGRKLWYVPLYFSIYFIIYVTVLILKAIARHKIQHKHKWVSHVRSSRKLNSDENEYLNNLTMNVTDAVDKAKQMYTLAM